MKISKLVCKECGKDMTDTFNLLADSFATRMVILLLHFAVHNPDSIKPKYEAVVDGEKVTLNWLGDKED
jgi:hypothetical protein